MAKFKDFIYLYEENIYIYKEAKNPTAESVTLSTQFLDQLIYDQNQVCIIVDVTDISPPDSESRLTIKDYLKSLNNINHIAIFSGNNNFLNTVARAIFSLSGFQPFTIHKTFDEALAMVKSIKTS